MKRAWIVLVLGLSSYAWAEAPQKTAAPATPPPAAAVASDDPYAWLEDVTGDKSLAWVKERNAESTKELADSPEFAKLESDLLAILDSEARIPYVGKRGPYLYNLWKDAKNPRGLWRRTTLEEYRKPEPKWDVVIDLDALGKQEGENWVWHGAQLLRPDYRKALVSLSRGGADADVVREFDMETRTFVKDGFALPEAKGGVSWIDADHIYVMTDFGPGSMTTSGYPRIAKLWTRGTPLAAAKTVYEGEPADLSVAAYFDDTPGFERHFVQRGIAFYRSQSFLRKADGTLVKIDVPEDANPNVSREWLTVELRTPWTVAGKTYAAGALLATRFDDFMAGKRDFAVLFEPTEHTSLAGYNWTLHHLILNVLDDVKNSLVVVTPGRQGWTRQPLSGAPPFSTASAYAVDADESDDYFMNVSGFLTPSSLLYGVIGKAPEKLKELPAFFDASSLEVSQHFATSKDGTRVPYFQVSPKGMARDGTHPTLLYGYGGFEISLTPSYSGVRRPRLAQPGRRLRGGEHPRRRRVRPALAPGGAEGEPPPRLRGLRGGGARTSSRAR